MSLDQIFNICFTAASVLIFAPFLLIRHEETLPRWVWDVLTVLLVAAWGAVIVLFILRKIRNHKEKKNSLKKR